MGAVQQVLIRTLTIALLTSVPAALLLLTVQQPLLRLFTRDAAVLAWAATTLPFVIGCMVCIMFPECGDIIIIGGGDPHHQLFPFTTATGCGGRGE